MEESRRLQHGDELTLEITGSAFEGKCVARHENLVVFVEGAVPGDTARVSILKSKKNFAEARVMEILKPSPHRVQPRCKYFGVCGGCTWQHVAYPAQLAFKQQHVQEVFEHIGGFSDLTILPILGSEETFFYRGKMEYSFADQEWLTDPAPKVSPEALATKVLPVETQEQHPIFLGLHVPQRFDKVLNIEECHLQSEISNRILNFTRRFAREHNIAVYDSRNESGVLRFLVIRESKQTHEVMVNLVTFVDQPELMREYSSALQAEIPGVTTIINTINSKRAQIAFGEKERVSFGGGVIHERLGTHQFDISSSSFFQTNVAQAERLYGVIRELGVFHKDDVVYDLYCGTGSISLFLANAVKQVVGIESVESAVRDAMRNAHENGIINCAFILGDLKDRLTKDTAWMTANPKPTIIVADPPRSGMHPKVVEELLHIAAERIVYVSCNPATQARDIKLLCASTYRLEKMQPVDMFPHTFHIENVALLRRQ
jgi:23S rRNA (uracil1939-C5)-methyltransferase